MMNEEVKKAFKKISDHMINEFGDLPKNNLITVGKGCGASEEELQENFPRMFEPEPTEGEEVIYLEDESEDKNVEDEDIIYQGDPDDIGQD